MSCSCLVPPPPIINNYLFFQPPDLRFISTLQDFSNSVNEYWGKSYPVGLTTMGGWNKNLVRGGGGHGEECLMVGDKQLFS